MFGSTWMHPHAPPHFRSREDVEQIAEENRKALSEYHGRMNRRILDMADRVQQVMTMVNAEKEAEQKALLAECEKIRILAAKATATAQVQKQADTELEMYEGRPATLVAGNDSASLLCPARGQHIDSLDPFASEEDYWPYVAASPYSPLRLDLDTDKSAEKSGHRLSPLQAAHDRIRLFHAFDDLFRISHAGEMHAPAETRESPTSDDAKASLASPSLETSGKPQAFDTGIQLHDEDNQPVKLTTADEKDDDIFRSTPIASTLGQIIREVESFAGGLTKAFSGGFGDTLSQRSTYESTGDPSSVVSTMTRTETRTLPDGSVETRRVLKRRFADGNEEHEESIDTLPPSREVPDWLKTHLAAAKYPTVDRQTQTHAMEATSSKTKPEEAKKENSQPGGWFWR